MRNNFKISIYFLSLVFILGSCKTSLNLTNTTALKNIGAGEILKNLEDHNKKAENYSIKYNAKVRFLNKKHTLNGLIRIKTDSLIWISIGPSLGVELMRIVATKDSLKYINKTNNTYYIGNYDYLKNITKLNINYEILESIMISQLFVYNSDADVRQELQYSSIDSNLYVLRNYKEKMRDYLKTDINSDFTQRVYIEPGTFQIQKVIVKDKKVNRNLTLDYRNYKEIDGYMVPEEITFNFNELNSLIQLTINYQKVSVNTEIKLPFRINKKFDRI